MKINDSFIIGVITGTVLTALLTYLLSSTSIPVKETNPPGNVSKDWTDVGGNIDIEYYLEVSEDSIWVENVQSHRVYGGKYSDLDSLILKDNL